jgi:sugar O-acyltransferase (sialic acid O-acetyltransferase NeuD family)
MQIVIIGAGGHGKVVLDIVRAAGRYEPIGFIDANTSLAGSEIGGLPVLGPGNILPRLRQQKIRGAIIAVGDNRARLRYAPLLDEHGFELVSAVHPSAHVSPTAIIGRNVVVAPHAAICTESRIDDLVIVNTAAVVDHECHVQRGAHICPGVHLAGRVRVGTSAFVGIGARVIQCLSIGNGATIGAGAVVIEDIPAFATAVGVPARVIKTAVASDVT